MLCAEAGQQVFSLIFLKQWMLEKDWSHKIINGVLLLQISVNWWSGMQYHSTLYCSCVVASSKAVCKASLKINVSRAYDSNSLKQVEVYYEMIELDLFGKNNRIIWSRETFVARYKRNIVRKRGAWPYMLLAVYQWCFAGKFRHAFVKKLFFMNFQLLFFRKLDAPLLPWNIEPPILKMTMLHDHEIMLPGIELIKYDSITYRL